MLNKILSPPEDPSWKPFVMRWMGVSLLLHLITAYFSMGYHSADEHFQILEFLNYKLGKTPLQYLAIEFSERMRPWMQPAIYWVMTQVELGIGIDDPFTWALSFRVVSGVLGWLSSFGLALCCYFWFPDSHTRCFAVKTLALIWFFPALHVRPSSESLGGSTFLLGLSLAYLLSSLKSSHPKSPSRSLMWGWVGVLFGLSFEFRFQMGLTIVGALAWLSILARIPKRTLFNIFLGIFLVFSLGRVVDQWGYGEWTLSPWNYISYNLIRGEVSRFGVAPWWDVFRMSFTESWPLLGFVLAISCVVAWIRHPKHFLTWSYLLFFVIHEWIAHKEFRFFFPIASAAPVLFVLSLCPPSISKWAAIRFFRWIWKFLVFNNAIALLALLFLPFARTVQFYEAVYKNLPLPPESFDLYTNGRDPFEILGTPTFFYRSPQLQIHSFQTFEDLAQVVKNCQSSVWLFQPTLSLPPDASPIRKYCHVVFQTLPSWVEKLNWNQWLERTNRWSLYRCDGSFKNSP